MAIVTTSEMKEQLNITFSNDDDLISRKIDAAQNQVERLLGYSIEDTFGGEDQEPIPDALVEAVSQLAAFWYEQREAANIGIVSTPIPFGVSQIVNEFREFTFDAE